MQVAPRSDLLRRAAFVFTWLLVFATPWEGALKWDDFGSVPRVVGILAMFVGGFAVAGSGHIRKVTVAHYLCIAFVIFVAISITWSSDSEATVHAIRTYFQIMFVLWLAWEFAPTQSSQNLLIRAFLLGCYVTMVGVYQSYESGAAYENALGRIAKDRFSSPGGDPNDMALTISIGLCFAMYLVHNEREWLWKSVAGAFVFLAPAAVILTGSRGGAIAASIAFCGLLPLFCKRRSRTLILVVLIVTVIVLTLLIVPGETLERISSITAELNTGDLNGRTALWRGGIRAFTDSPIVGSGANTFCLVVSSGSGDVAHNTFLSILVEEGIIGLVIFLAILVVLGRSLFRIPRAHRFYSLLPCCVWTIGVSTLTWEQRRVTWVLFALMIGLAASRKQLEQGVPEPMLSYLPRGEAV